MLSSQFSQACHHRSAAYDFSVKAKNILPLVLLAVFSLSRWPGLMPQNFSAAYAIAFCAGVYLPKRLAWWIPLGALLTTDILINSFFFHVSAFHISMLGNYLAFALIIWLGTKFSARASSPERRSPDRQNQFLRVPIRRSAFRWWKLLGGGMLAAIIFYLVTNTAAWLQLPDYPKNFAGLIQALTVGTPGWPHTWEFFRNTLLSGGLFTGLFVAAMKLEERSEETEKSPEPEEGKQPEEAGT